METRWIKPLPESDNEAHVPSQDSKRGLPLKRELHSLVTQMHSAGISYADALRQFKRRYLLEVLAHHKGNQCKAAEELGMHRNTLSRTLSELDLDSTQIRNGLREGLRPENIRAGMRRPPASERPRVQSISSAR